MKNYKDLFRRHDKDGEISWSYFSGDYEIFIREWKSYGQILIFFNKCTTGRSIILKFKFENNIDKALDLANNLLNQFSEKDLYIHFKSRIDEIYESYDILEVMMRGGGTL